MAEILPRICVIGGGLSGLTTAFFLQRGLPFARICVVERSTRCGGLIKSLRGSDGQVHEQGFHTSILNNKSGRETLGLARLLQLDDEVISANIEASSRRHLLHQGRVQLFPRLQHTLRYGPAIFAEPLWPPSAEEDESVHAFVSRRTSSAVADRIFDPICQGQLAGDSRRLSVRTCFPRLWFNEQRFRSVFLGSFFAAFSAYRQRSWLSLDLLDPLLQKISAGGRCYSFRDGMVTLVDKLQAVLEEPVTTSRPVEILRGVSATHLRNHGLHSPVAPSMDDAVVEVKLDDGRTLAADAVVAAIPPNELSHLLTCSAMDVCTSRPDVTVCQQLSGLAQESVAVASVAFDTNVMQGRFKGAGYFVGSLEKQQPVLAMSWDSLLFPDQDQNRSKARLTVYLGGEQCPSGITDIEQAALYAVKQHLGVSDEPVGVHAAFWPKALPQYAVGHYKLIRSFNAARIQHLPWLQVVGPGYFGTRGAADEIVDARKLADSICRRFARFPGLVENETEEDTASRYGGGFDTA